MAWRERNVYDDNNDEDDCVDLHRRVEKVGVSRRIWRQGAESKTVDGLPLWMVLP